jgi:Putative zinc- or iron-chelating domain
MNNNQDIQDNFPIHTDQVKSTIIKNSAKESSELCQECSMCCTGVIFSHVTISKKAHDKLPKANGKFKGDDFKMSFPCQYIQEGSCTVYTERPNRCKTYSCKLLDKVIRGEIPFEKANQITTITKKQVVLLRETMALILNIETTNLTLQRNFRDDLHSVHKLFSNRFNDTTDPIFETYEIEFCLNTLDFIKGLYTYFYESSLLEKYNNLVIKISSNKN